MKLTKEHYIHNRLSLDDTERDTLISASKIVMGIRDANIHSAGADDDYLNDICSNVLVGISELLDNYSNEYAGE